MGRWKNLSLDKEILALQAHLQSGLANISHKPCIFLTLRDHSPIFLFSSINTEFIIYFLFFWLASEKKVTAVKPVVQVIHESENRTIFYMNLPKSVGGMCPLCKITPLYLRNWDVELAVLPGFNFFPASYKWLRQIIWCPCPSVVPSVRWG